MTVTYYINGVSFSSLGVNVSSSKGLLSALKMKDPLRVTWPDQHGDVVDLAAPRYESRDITLECYIKSTSSTAFILAIQAFLAAFRKSGLQRLMIEVDDGVATRKPLFYMVYLAEDCEVTKKWSPATMIGTFALKLREPEPVKRVYKFVAATGALSVSMAITSSDPVNIYWGDGEADYDVSTASGTLNNNYPSEGTYYIVITGVIENITGITTTAILVWSRL